MQKNLVGAALLAVVGAGCGSVSDNHPTPKLVTGGGISGGKIDGYLNVYVTDQDTEAGVASAAVRVGASADPSPCLGTTDSTGLATFDPQSCPSKLNGPVDVTASAAGYAPSTWIGAAGADLTMQIQATNPAPVATAMVSGSIAGWENLTPPAAGHSTLALVAASQDPDLGDSSNNIQQPTRVVTGTIAGVSVPLTIPADACIRNVAAALDDCNWQLVARTGPQAHYAMIVDDDQNGTPNDSSDDVMSIVGWALATGLNLSANQTVTGESLAMVAAADLQPFSAAFPPLPASMTYLAAYPAIELANGYGRIAIVLPPLGTSVTMTSVPKLGAPSTSGLAGASYDFIAAAQASQTVGEPATLSWSHGVDVSKTVTVAAWLPTPTGIAAAAGTYSFSPVAGATLHSVEFKDPAAGRTWSVTIFDGSTSFTLPGLTPNPLTTPSGTDTMTVSALVIPGIDLTNVAFDDAQQTLTGLSSDMITFAY